MSSTSTTMSRHGSIFYDAPEALNSLLLNEDKDEIEKMVGEGLYRYRKVSNWRDCRHWEDLDGWRDISSNETHHCLKYLSLLSLFKSDSESSSCGDDESHAGDTSRPSGVPPQLSKCVLHRCLSFIVFARSRTTTNKMASFLVTSLRTWYI